MTATLCSDDLEYEIIGAILLDPPFAFRFIKELEPEDFGHTGCRAIFTTALSLHDQGDPVDALSLGAVLPKQTPLLMDIGSRAITAANVQLHTRLLKTYSFKRYINKYFINLMSALPDTSIEDLETIFSEILQKIQALTNDRHRDSGITLALKRFIDVTDGDFGVTECALAVTSVTDVTSRDSVTRRDKERRLTASVRKGLQRLKEEGYIQPVGKKNGIYRRVDNKAEEIEWWKAESDPLPVKYPMQIENFVHTLPKNIIVIAGEPNSGKTGFLLNFAARNLDNFPINYFSSEMGDRELKSRLMKFVNFPMENWRKVKFQERAGNFADVIRPDEVNIIDFLEVTQDFWIVAQLLKEVYDKLNKGICLIALQKNRGTDYGLGGQRGLEKPRLYISLGQDQRKRNICKIVKGKNWAREDYNPNGLQVEFKLVQGYKFMPEMDWHKEGELE